MFEKSKSAITFKEFQKKMNIVNDFDNDWGHFCDPDTFIYTNTNYIKLFKDTLERPKKRYQKSQLLEKIEKLEQEKLEQKKIEKIEEEKFIDIEKQKQKQNEKYEEPDTSKGIHNYHDNNYLVDIFESVINGVQTSFIILTMVYVIFNVL
jgi:hypothetical protein